MSLEKSRKKSAPAGQANFLWKKFQNAEIQGRTPGGGKKHDSNRVGFCVMRVQHSVTFPTERAADRKVGFSVSASQTAFRLQNAIYQALYSISLRIDILILVLCGSKHLELRTVVGVTLMDARLLTPRVHVARYLIIG